jgi:hypothetical protein
MFNIYLGIFIITAIFVIAGGSYKLVGLTYTLSAVIFFIGSLGIFIIFGAKWFNPNSIFAKTPVSWPTMTNTCPDYLIYYNRKTAGGNQDTCIDTIGVSKNGALKCFPSGKDPSTVQDGSYYFPLATKSSDPIKRNTELCQRAMTCGLTWEGITNGESCILPNKPGSSASDPANCPT